MAVIGYPIDNVEYLAEDAATFHATRTNGVYSSDTDYILSAPGGMQVEVSPGIAWMRVYDFGGASFVNRGSEILDIAVADSVFRRIDRVVVRFDRLRLSSYLAVKTGEPAVNPTAPGVTRDATVYEIGIGAVMVGAGAIQITAANLTDTRLDETICGIMRDDVTRIPTQALYDEWWAWFSELRMAAEEKAYEFATWLDFFIQQKESEFEEWFQTKRSELDDWISEFQNAYGEAFVSWYTITRDEAEQEILNLIDGLRGMLDEEVETALYKKIDDHEHLTVAGSGVHGLRLKDGWLQTEVTPGSWANLLEIKYGLRVSYINGLKLTVAQINMTGMTIEEINNSVEKESK